MHEMEYCILITSVTSTWSGIHNVEIRNLTREAAFSAKKQINGESFKNMHRHVTIFPTGRDLDGISVKLD